MNICVTNVRLARWPTCCPRYLTLFFFFANAIVAMAAPGDLDPAFGANGKVSFSFGGSSGTARGVLTQPDGKIVVVGSANVGAHSVFAVVRYNPDGSRDPSFGGNGEVVTDIAPREPVGPALSGTDDPQAVLLQADGKIVVAGSSVFGSNRDFAVARYLPDGSLDDSFGTGGIVTTDFGTDFDPGLAARLQGDKIVVAGFQYATGTNNYSFILARYNGDGSLDTTFNGTGKVTTPIGAGNGSYVGMAVRFDTILVAGSIFGPGGVNGVRVARYKDDGSLDPTFDNDGLVQTVVGTNDTVTAIAIQPGSESVAQPDKIVVGGYTFNGTQELFMALRYKLDGSLDTSFDGDGKVTVPIGSSRTARPQAIGVTGFGAQPRKIVLGGSASLTNTGSGSQMAAVRLNANGSLDTTLDQDGILTAQFGGADQAFAMSLAGSKIFLVGESFSPLPVGRNFALARFNTDGSLDGTFDIDGKKLDLIGGNRATARGVVVQPDGKLVLAGNGGYFFGLNFAVARLNADGTFDSSFGGGDGKIVESTTLLDAGNAVTLQPDGKIVLAGSRGGSGVGSNQDVAVVRYNADGSLDTSFSGGVVTTPVGSDSDAALAVALQSDGKIIVAGYGSTTTRDIAVVRFNPNGSVDSTFDFDGKVFAGLSSGDDEARAVAIQPNGKIIVAGVAGNTPKQFFVARLNPSGAFDGSFDGDGVAFTSIGPGDAEATSLAVDSLGRIIVGGFAGNGVDRDFAVARYLSNGSLDASFNHGGVVTTSFGAADDKANSVVIQADGKIVVAGGAHTAGSGSYAVARFDPDGSLDSGYGSGGKVVISFYEPSQDIAYGIALDSNGNAVVAGEALQQFGVARILAGPLASPTPTASPSATASSTPTATPTASPTATPTPTAAPATALANISTRLRVETGDNVLIGGFIITGTQPKKVIIRAIGPSLPLGGKLANPTLELYTGNTLLASNDDWQNQPAADRQAVIDSTIPPSNDLEAALVRTLPANGASYTAIVRGLNNTTGIGVVEVYDLDTNADSKLANISTRGFVQTDPNILIAGTIVVGSEPQKVIVRAIGPSLAFPGVLANPTLELRDQNGGLIEANDDWVNSPDKQAIMDSTIPPSNDLESAIVEILPGNNAQYTAIVRGVNDTTGIAVIEIYALQ